MTIASPKKPKSKRARPTLAFVRPTPPAPPPPMTTHAKYLALAEVAPDALLFIDDLINYTYDTERRRYPHLFTD